MLGEIENDKNYYCSADSYGNTGGCAFYASSGHKCDDKLRKICGASHRKWPTPEQFFKEEYGEEVPDDFPVWFIIPEDRNDNFHDWTLMVYAEALQYEHEEEEADFVPAMYIVCACTPFGKPDKDWRPE